MNSAGVSGLLVAPPSMGMPGIGGIWALWLAWSCIAAPFFITGTRSMPQIGHLPFGSCDFPETATENEFRQHVVLFGDGADIHGLPFEPHAAGFQHIAERRAVGFPA